MINTSIQTLRSIVSFGMFFVALACHAVESKGRLHFPDILGYQTIAADLHQHTVFSDGEVWPSIRVQESVRDGMDIISIIDHLEYQPHSVDIPHTNRNRAHEIATEAAEEGGLLIVRGGEVTRELPFGHINAIFLNDVNKLLRDDPLDAIKEAHEQGAFIFLNHPSWIAHRHDGIAKLEPMHKKLIKEGRLHGIEVVNGELYSEASFRFALKYGLAIIATTDVHGLTDWQFPRAEGQHRPATLIFAKEKTKESVKEAFKSPRTIGPQDYRNIKERLF